jgi:hypothetical protein
VKHSTRTVERVVPHFSFLSMFAKNLYPYLAFAFVSTCMGPCFNAT